MLRAKAHEFRSGKLAHPVRDRMLSSTDRNGRLATIPIVVHVVNGAARSKPLRAIGEKVMAVDKDAWVPRFAPRPFRSHAAKSAGHAVKDGERSPGKVAIFATCYVNYNEPAVGHDLLKILDHNAIPYVLAGKEACCGMPKLEQGDLESVAALKEKNIPRLAKLAREGYAIVTPVPSCTLMYKQELPLMFPEDEDVRAVRDAMFDPFEYLMARKRDGLLKTDFKNALGKIAYHIPCHSRVQNMGQKTREALELVPGTELNVVERCSGHDGTWGVKEEYFANSMKIGRPVFRQMAQGEPDYVSSDCPIAARHIMQGMAGDAGKAVKAHPLTLFRKAYGV